MNEINIASLLNTITTVEEYNASINMLKFLESQGLLADYPETLKVVYKFLEERLNRILDDMAYERGEL